MNDNPVSSLLGFFAFHATNRRHRPTDAQLAPPPETTGKIKKALGPIAVAGIIILKFLAKIKFILPILLKTGGSMLVTIGVYAMVWGWKFAVGFVLLIMLHECGHLIVAKKFGVKPAEIMQWNDLKAPVLIKGQALIIYRQKK